ncbi:MAG: outer membrane beta-barrel protein [Flavobacteriales bacterium]
MKRSSFLLLLPLFLIGWQIPSASAQKGVQVQLVGGAQNTWMFNNDDSDAGDHLDYQPTFGPHYGVRTGYFFTENIGVETGYVLFKHGQKYKHTLKTGSKEETFHSERILSYAKIPLLFHFRSQPGKTAFFTVIVGPQISMMNSLSTSSDGKIVKGIWGGSDAYASTTTDVVLGFGPGFSLSDKLKLDLHFRFDYSFTDAENKKADHWDDERPITNNASGGLQLGLTYGIGG